MILLMQHLMHMTISQWYKKSTEKGDKEDFADLSSMSSLEDNEEEVKEGKGLKNLSPNKLLASFPILQAQIKAGNNSYKLKYKIRQIVYLLY